MIDMSNALIAVQERSSNRAAVLRFNVRETPHANPSVSKTVVLSTREGNDHQNLLCGK